MNAQDRHRNTRQSMTSSGSLRRRYALRPLVIALAGASLLSLPGLAVSPAQAQAGLPSGMSVAHGQAQAAVNGQQMTVTNSANSILNWQSFSIGNKHGVHFAQPDSTSQVLNRVVGNDPSAILGSLSSNGRVWLLNPHGVLFGQNARVDVGGLVTSTLRLNDVDWLNGRFNFWSAHGDPTASIVNQGELRSSLGGRIVLLGGSVRNEGLIEAPDGQVMLAAGRSIDLVDTGSPNLQLRVTAPDGEALNLGTLAAAGGRIDVHGAVVNQRGIVRADGFATNAAGEVVIRASEQANLAAGSVTSASGGSGGRLQIDAGAAGTAMIGGDVAATGSEGSGGDVRLLGRQVGVVDAARVDASGSAGGGQVLVGGGREGKDPTVRNGEAVYVGSGATISADATQRGHGGHIILWSDQATRAYGSFSARGGSSGGNGGFIETSGGWIDVRPARIDASAIAGLAGTWLLDPFNILITDAATTGVTTTPPPPPPPPPDPVTFTASDNGARINSADIRAALNNGNSVIVSTGTSGSEPGDITLRNADINVAPNIPVSFSLNAARHILIDAGSSITSTGRGLSVNLNAARSGVGVVHVNASTIRTNGGNLVAGGTGFTSTSVFENYGIQISSSTIDSGAGNINLIGTSTGTGAIGPIGVFLNVATLTGRDLGIRGNADPGGSGGSAWGVLFSGGGSTTATHSLDIVGNSSGIGVRAVNTALRVAPASVDPSASLVINGTSASKTHGIDIAGQYGGSLTASNGASMTLVGRHAGGETASLNLSDGLMVGDATGGAASFTANSPAVIDASVHIGGPFTLFADDVTIRPGTSVRSDATGDAIIIAGKSGPNTVRFVNENAGCCALIAPNGRWLIFGQNTTALMPGGLVHDFRQYNARFGTPNPLTPATGNGLMYFEAPVVTVTGPNAQKTYDGTTTIALPGGLVFNGQRNLDAPTVAAGATGDFDNKNAGNAKPITIAPGAVTFRDTTGKPVIGYTLNSQLLGDILRKAVTLAGVAAQNKVYDGNTIAIVTVAGLNGLVGAETLTTNATGNFDNKDVGSNKIVNVAASLADGGGGGIASNYELNPNVATTTADITRRQLGGTVSAANKVYDGNNTATVTLTGLTNLVGGETLTITTSGNFDTKDVGNAKPVAAVIVLANGSGGGLAGNYIAPPVGTPRADITPAPLTVTANNASKTFGTTLVFNGTEFTTSALQAGETVGRVDLTSAGAASTASVAGGPYPIIPSNARGGTFDARNYDIRYVNGVLVVNPTALNAVLASIVGNPTKTYDGSDAATLSPGNYALSGFIGSDNASVVQTNGRYDSPNAGNRTVTVVLTGASFVPVGTTDLNNYVLPTAASGPGTIVPKPLTVAGISANNKTYDGSVAATLSNSGALVGLVGAQTLVLSNTGARFDTKDAGTGKPVTVDGLAIADGSGSASNYRLASNTATTTADINRRQLGGSFSAADKVYDGTTTAAVTLINLSNLVGSETLNTTTSGNFDNRNVGNNKPVSVVVVLANGGSGGLAANYLPPTGSTTASITPATLTYVADPASKLIDAPLPPLSGRVDGFVGGDNQGNATTGTLVFTTPATQASPVGRYPINGGGLAAQNYGFTQAASNATALSVTGVARRDIQADESGSKVALSRSLAAVAPPPVFSSPAEGRVHDVIQTLRGEFLGRGALFRAIPVEQMSQDALTSLLAARDQYKKALFAEAIRALERNPALADVPACTTIQEVDNGTCLITEDLKRQLRARRDALRITAAPPPATPTPSPAVPSAPAPAPAAPAAPAVEIPAAQPREAVGLAPAIEPPRPLFTRRVRSAALPQIQRKIAVVIGVNRYSDRRIPQLENAVGDARAIGQLLENQLGYETVVLENAGKVDVVRTLNRLAVELDPTDSVVVYYAGHGELIEATGIGYWQLSDSVATRPETWMSNADISRLIGRINADQVALISDSCYSGSLVDERIRARPGQVDPQQVLAKKTVVVMSSGGNEPVFDEGKNGHSPFAYNLMRNLEQVAAWQAGGNVFERVRFAVARELPQRPLYGSASAAGHQPGGDYLFEQRQLDSRQ
ncbi:YDG domain-containing protein [Piscinibacter sakaiensis]|uniref:YDG domain-containing protein n=1 Tax=Piscinibacter sakaiensis TaxID=1547922 RepID=UPI003AAFEACA